MSIVRSVSTLIAVPALASAALAQLPDAAAPTPLPIASPFPAASAPLTLATPVTAPLSPAPNPIGISPFPPAPGGPTLGSFLGMSYAQRQYRQMRIARTPLGQLRSKIQTPLSKLTGGLIPPFPPQVPSLAQLQAPGPVGAAAKVKLDRQGAKDRIEAVQYLGKVDCHYWPEAEAALVGALRADRNEWVRLAAAETLGKGCCCTKKTITALSIAATCSDADGNPSEKSPRVVAAAQAALSRCLATSCAGPAAMEAPPPTPPVERPRETPREAPNTTNQAAWSKPAPAGQEKSSGGLSPRQIARPTGDAFYERVKQHSWREVIAFARHAEAHSPMALAALPPVTPNLEPDTPGIEVADARTHSERPANLLDMLLHSDEEARVTLPVAANVAQFTPVPTPAPAQTATLPAPVARQALPMTQATNRPPQSQPQVASRPPQPQPAVPARPPAAEARQPEMPTPARHVEQSRLLATTPATETGTPPHSRPTPKPVETVAKVTEPANAPKTFPAKAEATTPKTFPADVKTTTAAPKVLPADAKPRKSPQPAGTMSTSAARVLTLLAHPTNPRQVAREIDQLAAWDVTAHPNTVRALMRTATASGGDELIRAACVRAVVRGKVKDAGTIASLERMTYDESVKVQVEAAAGLMELRGRGK
jgi:hypothetical protein